jgi:VanZ family protein
MTLSLRQKLIIISLLLYWPAIFVLAHIPIPQLVYKAQVSDKTLHLVVYLILVFLLWFAVSPDRRVNWRKAAVWWVFLIMAGYGGVDELLQGYVGRSCDIKDFLANLVGVSGGLILFSFLTFWPALLAVTGITIFCLTNLARANLTELVPVTNAMFHLLAYAVFTMLWIRQILPLPSKTSMPKRLIIALAVPIGLLLVVKLFSVVSGRYFTVFDVIISGAGIAIAPVGYVFICSKCSRRIH